MDRATLRKPSWLKVPLSTSGDYARVSGTLKSEGLNTVCTEAKCPNRAECWSCGTATFLILGDACTRGCAFCAVTRLDNPPPPDATEPARLAAGVEKLKLEYVVITSVTRDDLNDGGASHYSETINAVRSVSTSPLVEVLTPDFAGSALATVLGAGPDVFAHNIEVVESLSSRLRHSRFGYHQSLSTLGEAKELAPNIPTKSSILLGLGESRDEVVQTMVDLRDAGVDILVIGQYLQPSKDNVPVTRYVTPGEFASFAKEGEAMGFAHTTSGPLVRTSYKAAQAHALALGSG